MRRKALFSAVATCAALGAVPTLAGDSFFENWDSYATGQDMHGVGGWKGWDNDPTWTAFTTDDQALSGPNSIDIVDTADLVREFNYDSGVWTLTAMQYIPGNFTGETFFILLNTYADGGTKDWSSQVTFNAANGMVADSDGDVNTTNVPIIFDEWVEIRYEIDLDNDTFQSFYDGQPVSDGPWSQTGVPEIGAIDLFANGASSVYYDDISIVPAPGAIAVLGLAGLAARRRRRA